MKLLILGASKAQLVGITMAKSLGHKVITCDYIEKAIGHQYSDVVSYASTFDYNAVLKVAKEEQIDGIMTLGTDQPVYTAALVSKALGLPQVLSESCALAVTNKKVMKQMFIDNEIPTVAYTLYEKGVNDLELHELSYPVVVKPIDSQGQRGIFLLESPEEVVEHYEAVIEYSRCSEILVEAYYPHEEITVSGWVEEDDLTVLSITDRVTFESTDQLGICLAHELPSKHIEVYGPEIIGITEKITKVFGIHKGPIYYQFLLGNEGIKVNEIACRIGGAHEATFIPIISGFEITTAAINAALGHSVEVDVLKDYDVLKPVDSVSIQLFFCGPCVIKELATVDKVMEIEGVIDFSMNVAVGDEIKNIANATSRAGYAVIVGNNQKDLKEKVKNFYEIVRIIGVDEQNHIIHN